MSYRLRNAESIGDGLARILHEQLDAALDALGKTSGRNGVTAIHDARKHLKKLRAALRLLRPALSKDDFQTENRCFRQASRAVADQRDAHVRLETLDQLGLGRTDPAALALRKILTTAVRTAPKEDLWKTLAKLEASKHRIEAWPLHELSWVDLSAGLEQAYRDGRKAFRCALKVPDPERLHTLRKRLKDLWYHLRILRNLWPGVLRELAGQAKQLTELLGDDHDLVMLHEAVVCHPQMNDSFRPLLDIISEKRASQHHLTLALAERFFVEKPKAFRHRITGYWNSRTLEPDVS